MRERVADVLDALGQSVGRQQGDVFPAQRICRAAGVLVLAGVQMHRPPQVRDRHGLADVQQVGRIRLEAVDKLRAS